MTHPPPVSVAIIGGGLAGMAAALAARSTGLAVTLFEQSRALGGRVGTLTETWNGQILDAAPHVALGCCTHFLDFCRRLNLDSHFRRERAISFLEPGGRMSRLSATPLLPAPWHLLHRLLRLKFLSLGQRWRLVRTLKKLVRSGEHSASGHESLGDWLRRQGESERALRFFWSPVVQSALSETLDFVSLATARKVFEECFFTSRQGYEMILPQRPWCELLDQRAGSRLGELGAEVQRGRRVMWIEPDPESAFSVVLADGAAHPFDAVILAVPWHQAASLLAAELLEEAPELGAVSALSGGAIAAVHLWFDRPITSLPHAVLLSKFAPWIFAAPMHFPSAPASQQHVAPAAHYYQAVLSAAHRAVLSDPKAIRNAAVEELREFLPEAREARLLHAREVLHPQAVLSPQPGSEPFRPGQKTSLPQLFLAGDWTATGWPATMESAVRSGYRAVRELIQSQSTMPRAGGPSAAKNPDASGR